MPRYSDKYQNGYDHGYDAGYKDALEQTHRMIEENVTEWTPVYSAGTGWLNGFRCTACNKINKGRTAYCPHCGRRAKIDE